MKLVSPAIRKGSRLVARIFSSGQVLSSVSARSAHASTRCSQLSRIRSALRPFRCSTSASVGERSGASRTPSAAAVARTTSSGSESGASSTHHTPLSNSSTISCAIARASRVLPAPPGPRSVRRRRSESSPSTSAISLSRPTKLLGSSGKLSSGNSGGRGAEDPVPVGSATRSLRDSLSADGSADVIVSCPRLLRVPSQILAWPTWAASVSHKTPNDPTRNCTHCSLVTVSLVTSATRAG